MSHHARHALSRAKNGADTRSTRHALSRASKAWPRACQRSLDAAPLARRRLEARAGYFVAYDLSPPASGALSCRIKFFYVNIMATKNVITDLVKGEKLNGDNYDIWHKKMKFMLNEQELEEHLTKEMVAPTEAQPLRDHTASHKWNQKDRSARYTLLSSLQNDLIGQYDELPTCKALWEQLKFSFGGTSTTRLRSLVIKFEEYTKDPKHTMSEHLRVMSNMIGKLRDAGHALTDEQQVRAVIRSLPASWANIKQILTHSENIKNFSDVSQHVILEAETRDADKTLTYVAQEGSRNANGKRGRQSKKGKRGEASTSAPKEGENEEAQERKTWWEKGFV
ncbi:hypothetical protein RJ640_028840 [Escallonia rubra]|uniref:Uncharacterized protein n=1 Tax=Escallonia rubra TaxID=112253 RepID=A0AA88QRS9_9ASTE|nr:hypothetical protein RJ640_028840 [Escallonia rubra]